uniref:Putative secretory peptide-16 n=1 Tax=Pleurobrachia bachei TaxID=34499 RepID=M4H260_PLEBA|nr:putative secretory peptide-16 [Pleurobrachia bachei]|eukprot:sb/3475638/
MTSVYLFAVLFSIFSCDLQGYVGAVSATYFAFSSLRIDCWSYECCLEGERRSSWVHNNPDKLDKLLTDKLFGQHIAYKHRQGTITIGPRFSGPRFIGPRFSDRINFPQYRKLTLFDPDLVVSPI